MECHYTTAIFGILCRPHMHKLKGKQNEKEKTAKSEQNKYKHLTLKERKDQELVNWMLN